MCNGHQWALEIYPGGDEYADDGYVSICLLHCSKGNIRANYELQIFDKFGKKKKAFPYTHNFEGRGDCGLVEYLEEWDTRLEFIERSIVLNESKNLLDSDGALTVGVSIKVEPSDVYVPKNPFNKMVRNGIILDEDTADVCFEVCSAEAKKGKKKKSKASDLFHAHYCILKKCAPMLANLFDLENSNGKVATATIIDIKPNIFRHMLFYVYGGSVPDGKLETHAKDIIDAADKYSIVNLKLEAEAVYVTSTDITMDNAMENLHYADAKNCALLKEAVFDFIVQNGEEVIAKFSFDDFPGHLAKDLLVATTRKSKTGNKGDQFNMMRVSELRRKLHEKGLEVDGSREAMIAALEGDSCIASS
jgi:speckle-type POZ protein